MLAPLRATVPLVSTGSVTSALCCSSQSTYASPAAAVPQTLPCASVSDVTLIIPWLNRHTLHFDKKKTLNIHGSKVISFSRTSVHSRNGSYLPCNLETQDTHKQPSYLSTSSHRSIFITCSTTRIIGPGSLLTSSLSDTPSYHRKPHH